MSQKQPELDTLAQGAGELARVTRGEFVESIHMGHLVIVDPTRQIALQVGNPEVRILARSALKPLFAAGMLQAGFRAPTPKHLAIAAASHSGESHHLAAVAEILEAARLGPEALQNTPSLPLGIEAAAEWERAGRGPTAITQNCSGKHAALLATTIANGWDAATYLTPGHPVRTLLHGAVCAATGEATGAAEVDGCGAPVFSTTLAGLARAYLALGSGATPEDAQVRAAMANHPEYVGGTGRDVTIAMRAVPGLIVKDGAEGVMAGALSGADPGSTWGFAWKVLDGSRRPSPVLLAAVVDWLTQAGVIDGAQVDQLALQALRDQLVLGHGLPVGRVIATLPAWGQP